MEQHMWKLLNAGPLKLLLLLCTLQCFNGHLVVTEYIHNAACSGGSGQGLKGAQQQICAPGIHKRLIQPYLPLDSPSLCCQGRKGTNIITGDGIIVHFSDRDKETETGKTVGVEEGTISPHYTSKPKSIILTFFINFISKQAWRVNKVDDCHAVHTLTC